MNTKIIFDYLRIAKQYLYIIIVSFIPSHLSNLQSRTNITYIALYIKFTFINLILP